MASNQAKHILLRYAQSLSGLEDTISEHQAILERSGQVWFGKVGRPFGQQTIKAVAQQSDAGINTYLYLAANAQPEFVVHRANIGRMTLDLPDEERALVPDYYSTTGLLGRVGTWFRLTQLNRIPAAALSKLVVAATGTPVLSVVGSSRSSMFIVAPKVGAAP